MRDGESPEPGSRAATPAADIKSERPAAAGAGSFDPLEEAVRGKVRTFIEAILEEELEASLSRKRYERHHDGQVPAAVAGHRHGHRERTLTGTFGVVSIRVPDGARRRVETLAEIGVRAAKRQIDGAERGAAILILARRGESAEPHRFGKRFGRLFGLCRV
jgi:hypothetical protein